MYVCIHFTHTCQNRNFFSHSLGDYKAKIKNFFLRILSLGFVFIYVVFFWEQRPNTFLYGCKDGSHIGLTHRKIQGLRTWISGFWKTQRTRMPPQMPSADCISVELTGWEQKWRAVQTPSPSPVPISGWNWAFSGLTGRCCSSINRPSKLKDFWSPLPNLFYTIRIYVWALFAWDLWIAQGEFFTWKYRTVAATPGSVQQRFPSFNSHWKPYSSRWPNSNKNCYRWLNHQIPIFKDFWLKLHGIKFKLISPINL